MTMKGDLHEPLEMAHFLSPCIPYEPAQNLNGEGYADYLWDGVEGQQQAERKTWYELLSDTGSVEDQLRREMQAHPEVRTVLLLEGVALPTFEGTQVYTRSKGSRVYLVPGKTYNKSIDSIYAWLYQVSKYMEVYFSPSLEVTARMLVRFYLADQETDHETFRRYVKTADWHPNMQVRRLLGVSEGVPIGPEKAQRLIAKFGTVWNVLSAGPGQLQVVEGVGKKLEQNLLRGVGRPDV